MGCRGGETFSPSTSSSGTSPGLGGSGGAPVSTGGAANHGGGGASSSSSSSSSSGAAAPTRVRIVAANLSSGTAQSWDPGHGIRILQGVHGDVMLMQEMNYGNNTDADLRALADAVCGQECAYHTGNGAIPNGVVSRYPFIESGSWADPQVGNRDFAWARIDVPGPVDLWVVSVHLLTTSSSERNAEAKAIVAELQAKVPAADHVVVGGDFNTGSRNEGAINTFSARLSTAAPFPADGKGNGDTNAGRSSPYDWVLASPGLRSHEDAVRIGASQFPAGLVVDTRVYTPLDELSPALAGDSDAPYMQHMAVVRDFVLP
jgi:endonuclease/exonuclease/phosphatase family metal-dependent hydrolase